MINISTNLNKKQNDNNKVITKSQKFTQKTGKPECHELLNFQITKVFYALSDVA